MLTKNIDKIKKEGMDYFVTFYAARFD